MKTSDNDKTAITFDTNQNVKSKMITVFPSKGIYLTYADVLNGEPLDESILKLRIKKKDFICLIKPLIQKN